MLRPPRRDFYSRWSRRCHADGSSTVSFHVWTKPLVLVFSRQLIGYFFFSNFLGAITEHLLLAANGKLPLARTHHPRHRGQTQPTVSTNDLPTYLPVYNHDQPPTELETHIPPPHLLSYSAYEKTLSVHLSFNELHVNVDRADGSCIDRSSCLDSFCCGDIARELDIQSSVISCRIVRCPIPTVVPAERKVQSTCGHVFAFGTNARAVDSKMHNVVWQISHRLDRPSVHEAARSLLLKSASPAVSIHHGHHPPATVLRGRTIKRQQMFSEFAYG